MKLLSAMTVLLLGVQILYFFKTLKKLTSEKNRILRSFTQLFFFSPEGLFLLFTVLSF